MSINSIKKALAFFLLLFTLTSVISQVSIDGSTRINYQFTIRDISNNLVANKPVGIEVSILLGSESGTVLYSEMFMPTTNLNGLATIEVGGGSNLSGNYNAIDWSKGPFFLKTRVRLPNEKVYSITGTSKFLSVPFALHAKKADKAGNGISSIQDNNDGTLIINYHDGSKYITPVLKGLLGPHGLKGEKGDEGPKGDIGATGPQGIQGLKGDQGDQGPKGDTGTTGPQGIQGLKGDQGLKGNIGTTGPQGIQGLKGDQGLKGETGLTGVQGIKGDTGTTGPQGIQGLKGDQGIQGEKGEQGPKGDIGATGPQGIQGFKGDQGLKGDIGTTGPQGIQGLKGETGLTGVQGIKGDTGSTGPQGIQGLKGDQGSQGIQGTQGLAGNNGSNGTTGQNTLVKSTTENAGSNCVTGGVKLEYGLDANINGSLDISEINATLTKYLCNGEAGPLISGTSGQTLRNNGTTWVATSNLYNNGTQIGFGTSTPNTSAIVDISSTAKGVLMPTMTQIQRDAIITPATGLLVFQTDNTSGFYFYNGLAWVAISTSASSATGSNSNTLLFTNDGF